jgi:hypothetical protein
VKLFAINANPCIREEFFEWCVISSTNDFDMIFFEPLTASLLEKRLRELKFCSRQNKSFRHCRFHYLRRVKLVEERVPQLAYLVSQEKL